MNVPEGLKKSYEGKGAEELLEEIKTEADRIGVEIDFGDMPQSPTSVLEIYENTLDFLLGLNTGEAKILKDIGQVTIDKESLESLKLIVKSESTSVDLVPQAATQDVQPQAAPAVEEDPAAEAYLNLNSICDGLGLGLTFNKVHLDAFRTEYPDSEEIYIKKLRGIAEVISSSKNKEKLSELFSEIHLCYLPNNLKSRHSVSLTNQGGKGKVFLDLRANELQVEYFFNDYLDQLLSKQANTAPVINQAASPQTSPETNLTPQGIEAEDKLSKICNDWGIKLTFVTENIDHLPADQTIGGLNLIREALTNTVKDPVALKDKVKEISIDSDPDEDPVELSSEGVLYLNLSATKSEIEEFLSQNIFNSENKPSIEEISNLQPIETAPEVIEEAVNNKGEKIQIRSMVKWQEPEILDESDEKIVSRSNIGEVVAISKKIDGEIVATIELAGSSVEKNINEISLASQLRFSNASARNIEAQNVEKEFVNKNELALKPGLIVKWHYESPHGMVDEGEGLIIEIYTDEHGQQIAKIKGDSNTSGVDRTINIDSVVSIEGSQAITVENIPEWKQGAEWKRFEEARRKFAKEELISKKQKLINTNEATAKADYEAERLAMSDKIKQTLIDENNSKNDGDPSKLTPEQITSKVNNVIFDELVDAEDREYKKAKFELKDPTLLDKVLEAKRELLSKRTVEWYLAQNKYKRLAVTTAVVMAGVGIGAFAGGAAAGSAFASGIGYGAYRGVRGLASLKAMDKIGKKGKEFIEHIDQVEKEEIEEVKKSGLSLQEQAEKFRKIREDADKLRSGTRIGTAALGIVGAGAAGMVTGAALESAEGLIKGHGLTSHFFESKGSGPKTFDKHRIEKGSNFSADRRAFPPGNVGRAAEMSASKTPVLKAEVVPEQPKSVILEKNTELPKTESSDPALHSGKLSEASKGDVKIEAPEVKPDLEKLESMDPEMPKAEVPDDGGDAEGLLGRGIEKTSEQIFSDPSMFRVKVEEGGFLKTLNKSLENNERYHAFSEGKKNYILQHFANEAPSRGYSINGLEPGQEIDFNKLLDPEEFNKVIKAAEELSPQVEMNQLKIRLQLEKFMEDNGHPPANAEELSKALTMDVKMPRMAPSSAVQEMEEYYSMSGQKPSASAEMIEKNPGVELAEIPRSSGALAATETEQRMLSSIEDRLSSIKPPRVGLVEWVRKIDEITEKRRELTQRLTSLVDDRSIDETEFNGRNLEIQSEINKLNTEADALYKAYRNNIQSNFSEHIPPPQIPKDHLEFEKLPEEGVPAKIHDNQAGEEVALAGGGVGALVLAGNRVRRDESVKNKSLNIENGTEQKGKALKQEISDAHARIRKLEQTQQMAYRKHFVAGIDKIYGKGIFRKTGGLDTAEWEEISDQNVKEIIQYADDRDRAKLPHEILRLMDNRKHKELLKVILDLINDSKSEELPKGMLPGEHESVAEFMIRIFTHLMEEKAKQERELKKAA